jgi:hypothetical protein
MLCLERQISSDNLDLSMGVIELLLPIIDELVRFDIDRPSLFHLQLSHLGVGGIGRVEKEEDETETQNEPTISQDLSPGRK